METDEDPLCWTAEGEIFNETGLRAEMERVDDAIRIVVPKDREYTYDYDESLYYQNFEESYKERKIERIK